MELANKTILLTGATGGIGQAIARSLAQQGCHLVLSGRRERELDALVENLPNSDKHKAFDGDLTLPEDRKNLAIRCEQLEQGIDGIINNAGIGEFALLEHAEHIEEIIHTNLLAPILLTQELLPVLRKKQQAFILNIGSTLGSVAYPGYSPYCASKFGLRGFSEALRRELSDCGIAVLYAAPRTTATDILTNEEKAFNRELGNTVDSPEDVAASILRQLQAPHGKYRHENIIGGTQSFASKFNALLPGTVDKAIAKQLEKIKPFMKGGK